MNCLRHFKITELNKNDFMKEAEIGLFFCVKATSMGLFIPNFEFRISNLKSRIYFLPFGLAISDILCYNVYCINLCEKEVAGFDFRKTH